MDKIAIAKNVVKIVVGAGVAKIVSGVINNNTDARNVADKIALSSAAFVIGTITADITGKYTDAKIDEIVNWLRANLKNPKL